MQGKRRKKSMPVGGGGAENLGILKKESISAKHEEERIKNVAVGQKKKRRVKRKSLVRRAGTQGVEPVHLNRNKGGKERPTPRLRGGRGRGREEARRVPARKGRGSSEGKGEKRGNSFPSHGKGNKISRDCFWL